MEAQVIWYFSLMQFWTFVGDLFDTRQAKRVFPLLAVGALLGMIGVASSVEPWFTASAPKTCCSFGPA